MKHISLIMKNSSQKRAIMRRVYYSYAVSIVSQRLFLEGMFLSIAAFLLAKWLHVSSIIDNFLAVPVREAPTFVTNSFVGAISHGEIATALVFVTTILISISVARNLALVIIPRSLATR